jgi:hypothetical protein
MNNRLISLIPAMLTLALCSIAATLHAQTGSASSPSAAPTAQAPSGSTPSTATRQTAKDHSTKDHSTIDKQSVVRTLIGKVTAVDFKAGTFTLQPDKSSTKGALKTFHTSNETTYQFQDHETKLGDLKRGLRAEVEYTTEGIKKVASIVQICDCNKCHDAKKCDCCPHEHD